MDEALYDEMFRLERSHWWFAARRTIVLALLSKLLPVGSRRIYDIGCGCGMMLSDLTALGYDAVGIDSDPSALEYCKNRGVQAIEGTIPGRSNLPPRSADAILLLDVLEHIDDDGDALNEAMELLVPGGVAICTVPAYRWLWTARDKFHHHKRRYAKSAFAELLASGPNRKIEMISYMNTFLFPPALIRRLTDKILPQGKTPGDLNIPPLGINSVLKGIFAAERFFLTRRLTLPFGLSLIAVLRKK